jgi:hypothetical protein
MGSIICDVFRGGNPHWDNTRTRFPSWVFAQGQKLGYVRCPPQILAALVPTPRSENGFSALTPQPPVHTPDSLNNPIIRRHARERAFLAGIAVFTMKNFKLAQFLNELTSCNPTAVETPLVKGITDNAIPRPFQALPNVAAVRVLANVLDPLLVRHGIAKKLSPTITADPLSRRIAAANRYLRIMQNRLAAFIVKGDLRGFWILAIMLLRRSKVLRIVALRRILPQ